MRFHAQYPLLQSWLDSRNCEDLFSPEHLAIARLEPALRDARRAVCLLDLIFSDGERVAVIPYLHVPASLLVERERTPIIWPAAARSLGADRVQALEDALLPWLRSIAFVRQVNEETIRRFSPAVSGDDLERARRASFIGAAPYRQAMIALAPYVYAARYCEDRTPVGICDAQGASGAATLVSRGACVQAHLGDDERNALGAWWHGRAIYRADIQHAHVSITRTQAATATQAPVRIVLDADAANGARLIEIATPVPMSVMVSFDVQDSPRACSFTVQVDTPLALRDAPVDTAIVPAGGSSGKILLLLRDEFESVPDADVDEAQVLAERLRAEGFTVELLSPGKVAGNVAADLVHTFDLRSESARQVLEHFRARGVPLVGSIALMDDEVQAGLALRLLPGIMASDTDEAQLEEHLRILALGHISDKSDLLAGAPAALALLDSAIVADQSEQERLRGEYGFKNEIVCSPPPLALRAVPPEPIAALVGTRPFIFVHAPVEWGSNLPLLMRAAAKRAICVVVAGPVAEPEALRAARKPAPDLLIHLPRPSEGEIEALYRSARVFADIAWSPRSAIRLARARARGCRILRRPANPADSGALQAALETAWNAQAPAISAQADGFPGVIYAYARALAARAPA